MLLPWKAAGSWFLARAPSGPEMGLYRGLPADDVTAQATLAAIVESSDDAIISSTPEGIVRTWNRGSEILFGYTADEIVGQPTSLIIPPDRQHEEPGFVELLKAGQRVNHFETVRVTKAGSHVDVAVTVSPIKDASGRTVGFSTTCRDMTAEKDIQRALYTAKERAEAASNAKDHFLSILSHELRTPLTPVLAEISYLETQPNLPAELREHIGMIRRNLVFEARLVDDLLDLTRIRRQKLCLRLQLVDVHQILLTAVDMVQTVVNAKSIDVAVSLQAASHSVWGDPDRLQQVFMNLLSNAAKFTPECGLITLRTSNPATGQLQIEVQDNGIGIETDMLLRLFNAFEQAERTRRFGGLGLGLWIAKSLIELHNGTITASSDGPNRGAMFVVELATAARAEPAVPVKSNENTFVAECRILYVEDHRDTRQVMERLLKLIGCSVISAGDVREALSLAQKHDFDLLVTDIDLPDGSGLQIMEAFRTRKNIRGIAISGLGQEDDLRRSREAGFEIHLIKPINFPTLREAIMRMSA